jgi:hypothetical protein
MRRPLGGLARRHPFISAAAFIGVGLIAFVLVWFQPQKLFLNKTVNEPVPGVIQTAPAGSPRLAALRRRGWRFCAPAVSAVLSTRRRARPSCCTVPAGA